MSIINTRIKRANEEEAEERLRRVWDEIEKYRLKGPFIDPYTCKVLNNCNAPEKIIKSYKKHIKHMRKEFTIKSAKYKYMKKVLGLFGAGFDICLTIFACILYILETYYDDNYRSDFRILDLIIVSFFLADWFYRFFYTQRKYDFVVSSATLIDALTIVPIYADLIFGTLSSSFNFFRILRVLRIIRFTQAFKVLRGDYEDNEIEVLSSTTGFSAVVKQLSILVVTLFSVLFIGAGLLNALNATDKKSFYVNSGDFDFLTAFYYTIVTTATVGYGDVYPIATSSRIIVVLMILTMLYVISDQLSKLSQLVGNYSKYDTKYNLADHIIVMGYYTPAGLSRFLSQFYHMDHGKTKSNCVVIGNGYPNEELLKLFKGKYKGKVKYLEGDPIFPITLEKANAYMADSIFILTNQHDKHPESKDISAIMITKMAQHFSPYTQTYLQLVRPFPDTIAKFAPWHTVLSIQNIKMSILGLSVYNQGFSTLITSLYTTNDLKLPSHFNYDWLLLAAQGLSQEIYCVAAPKDFANKLFIDIVKEVYLNSHGVLVLGVKASNTKSGNKLVLINPCQYTVQSGDKLFVIAEDQETADRLTTYVSASNEKNSNSLPQNQSHIEQAFIMAQQINNSYQCNLTKGRVYHLWKDDLNGEISNHIIIFGEIEGLSTLIRALRSYSLQPICFVNEAEPSSEWIKLTEQYQNLYFFKGSLRSYQEMYKSAVCECKAVIILASANKNDFSPDSDAILVSRLIEMSFPHINVYVELSDEAYIRFLGNRPKGKCQELPHLLWPQHLSGKCFFSCYLDSLICQIYYNQDLIDILSKITAIDQNEGEILENSKIHTIKIPSIYFYESVPTYENLFFDLLSLQFPIIPIGIMSRKIQQHDYRPNEAILINPLPSTILNPNDSIICIGYIHNESRRTSKRTLASSSYESSEVINRISSTSTECDISEDLDAMTSILSSLKSRITSRSKLSAKIDKKNELIQSLNKEVEELKEELSNQDALF
ncbi:unnamed protein product [Blepharisma stoltei]|uniref:Uncharacterized protein n=1 Tax=Blepharisma stoltei TaxID=1481888 RepID=A0AAU9IUK9_9CILI|nr:unnamed protein product [Blepharisma stoltei]